MSTINSVVSTLLGRPDSLHEQIHSRSITPRTSDANARPEPVRLPDTGDIRQRGTRLAQLSARLLPAEQSAYAAEIAQDGLTNISELITDLRRLVNDAEHFQNTTGREDVSLYQRQIDAVSRSIQNIAEQTSFAGTKLLGAGGLGEIAFGAARGGGIQPPGVGGGPFQVLKAINLGDAVSSASFSQAPISAGETVEVNVEVLQSAQLAGFVLSVGTYALDLGSPADVFTIEIQGAGGTQELAFASGTTIQDVVAAINSFSNDTGVVANRDDTAIELVSSEYGSDEFVSVRVIDDGNLNTAPNAGVYSYEGVPGFGDSVEWRSHVGFADLDDAQTDNGIDVGGTINGMAAQGAGLSLRINDGGFRGRVDLELSAALELNEPFSFTLQVPPRGNLGGRALGAIIEGEGLEKAAVNREPALELIGQAEGGVAQYIESLGAFGDELRRVLSESLASAEGIAGLDLDPEAARSTAALAVQAVLQDDPRGLVSALANFTPERTLSLLARET
jgi:hypothetical protein